VKSGEDEHGGGVLAGVSGRRNEGRSVKSGEVSKITNVPAAPAWPQ